VWRRQKLLVRGVLFVVTFVAVALFALFCELLHLPRGIVAGVLAIGAAEALIRRGRFFHTGIEEGLWLAGTIAMIFVLPSDGRIEALLVFAAAAALSGWRVRNEIFGAAAAVLVIVYAGQKWSGWYALVAGGVIAIVAAFAMQRMWQRRTTDRVFAVIAVVAPLAGYVTHVVDEKSSIAASGWMFALAALLIAFGVRQRDRMLLIGGALAAACGGYEARDVVAWPVETKLIAAGVIVVAIAALIARALRGRTAGFISTAEGDDSQSDALQLAGTFALAPHHAPAPHEGGPQLDNAGTTDASFGGAGAGGGF
jgi:hypothetical protein